MAHRTEEFYIEVSSLDRTLMVNHVQLNKKQFNDMKSDLEYYDYVNCEKQIIETKRTIHELFIYTYQDTRIVLTHYYAKYGYILE